MISRNSCEWYCRQLTNMLKLLILPKTSLKNEIIIQKGLPNRAEPLHCDHLDRNKQTRATFYFWWNRIFFPKLWKLPNFVLLSPWHCLLSNSPLITTKKSCETNHGIIRTRASHPILQFRDRNFNWEILTF